ncbi:MAG: site-2 protease family protein [Candidatus Njordarchaeia archaeon]
MSGVIELLSDLGNPITQFLLMTLIWSVIAFFAHILKLKEKTGLSIYPLVLIYESKRFVGVIEKQAEKNKKIWSLYAKFSGPITMFFVLVAIGYFLLNFVMLYQKTMLTTSTGMAVGSPLVPIIPFITIPLNLFIILLLASSIAIIPHEFAHGIVARNEGVPLKSAGLYVFFGVILGGFVKLDESFEEEFEKIMEKKNERDNASNGNGKNRVDVARKLYKVASAGILANLILALVFFGAIAGLFETNGVLILGVEKGSPAYNAGLKTNDVILGINNYTIKNLEDLRKALSHFHPGDNVSVITDRGALNVTLGANPRNSSYAYLGVSIWDYYKAKIPFIDKRNSIFLYILLNIIYILQITVIFLNALPLYITDGAKAILAYLISKDINPKTALNIYNLINIIGLSILVANLWISILG